MLEHTGQRSGQARFVRLEVVDRPGPDRFTIVGRVPAQAPFMTPAAASAALDRYQHGHPGAWDRLRQVIEKAKGHPVGQLPMFELLLDRAPAGTGPSPGT